MAKFCGKCGTKLDETTGLCPNCDADKLNKQSEPPEAVEIPNPNQEMDSAPKKPLSKKEAKKQRKADKKAAKKDKKAQKKAAKKAKKKEKWASMTLGQKIRRFSLRLILLIALLIVVTGGMLGALSYWDVIEISFIDNMLQLFEIESDILDEETEFSILDGKFTETKVTDTESAIKAVQEGAEKLGLSNTAQELTLSSMNTVHGLTYYRLQQNYKGYPVYGKDFVLLVDNYGDVSGMTGNCFDITIEQMNPIVTQEEVDFAISEFIMNLADVANLEYVDIELISKENLCIYTLENRTAKLVYELYVDTEYGNYTFFVDANNAEIVFYSNNTFHIQQEFTYDGQQESCTFVAKAGTQQNEMYYIGEDGTKITIYIPNSEHPYDWYYDDNSTVVSWSKNDVPDSSAVDAMYNVSNVYNYYLETFNQSSLNGLGEDIDVYIHTIGYRDYKGNDKSYINNAYFWTSPNGPIISFTKRYDKTGAEIDEYSCEVDVIGHEFTHGIVAYTAGLSDTKNNLMPGAINEAVADIMGYCAEAKITGKKIDWTSSVRTSIKDNNSSSNFIYHTDDYKGDYTECHSASTIISYAAYLMNTASIGSLDDNEVARLWYHTILTLPSNCTFKALRQHVELVAKNLAFSEQQKESIAYAFDAVGITLDKYNPDIVLKVYDYNLKPYDDYTISIEGKYNTGWFGWSWFGLFKKNYSKQFLVDTAQEQHINLNANGKYTITVSDNGESKEIYKRTIEVKKKYENSVMAFATYYGKSSTDSSKENFEKAAGKQDESIRTTSGERDIVLVLDVSGSMSGTPMEETKKASVNFIDTILDEDASIGIVTYDNSSSMLSDFSVNKSVLTNAVSDIWDGGGTNIEAGLAEARSMLSKSSAKKKIIVLMSDGEPNDGKEGDDLITYTDELKDDGIIIYTLGFFENMDGYKSSAQLLMEGIASDGCHYEVASADDLVFFFEDVADQINGQKYIYIRIACPVDVTVTYKDETLCSAEDDLNVRTDFGTLTFEDNENISSEKQDDRIKVLRLKEGADYDVQIVGTGHGIMDYTIGFMDENGDYSDFRRFENIKITRRTTIDTVAAVSKESVLNIDEDGDGKYDLKLRAEENGYGEEFEESVVVYVVISGVALLLLSILLFVVRRNKKIKKIKENN